MEKYVGFEELHRFETVSDSKARIINSAIYHFAQDGYVKATTKDIAGTAEVSEALLFKYYGNKQRLLGEVCKEILEHRLPVLFDYRLDELLGIEGISDAEMRKALTEKVLYLTVNIGYFKIIFIELEHNSEDMTAELKDTIEYFFDIVEKRIKVMQKMSFIKNELQPRVIFRSALGMFVIMILDWKLLQPDMDVDQQVDSIVEILWNGVRR